jgi:diacylglycerol kinase (ATP)
MATTYAARGVGGASTSASTIVSSYANDRRRCATFSRRRDVATRGGRAEDESTSSADDDGIYVFVNCKSGGRQGGRILRRLRKVLKPPNYVFDATKVHKLVAAGEPTLVLPWPENARVLVCGGDGTVGLVHDALERARETQDVKRELPPMAIAPLGTGNDLARVLGWHGDVWNENRLYDESELVRAVRSAVPRAVDRWRVQFTPISNETTTTDMTTTKLFTNYMSVGVDARAALAFHRARKDERWTWLFAHELTNKLLYAIFGSRDFIEHSFAGLRDEIFVQVDGVPIELPEDTEGLVFLNINSFSGGCRMWWHDDDDDAEDTPPPRSNNSFKRSRMDDGVLEIVAVSGALQLGQLNVRMPSVRPVRVAQGSDVKITICGRRGRRKFPMQVDGEPWNQKRDTIVRVNRLEEESPASSLVMLSRPKEERLADVIAKWFAANHSSDDGDDADAEGSTKRRRRRTTMPFVRILVRAICFAVAATFVFFVFARRVAVL